MITKSLFATALLCLAPTILTAQTDTLVSTASAILENLTKDRRSQFPYTEGFSPGQDMDITREIAPGVVHRFQSLSDGPLTINSVMMDLSRDDLVLEAVKAGDLLRDNMQLPKLLEKLYTPDKRPIAAINGDFWAAESIPVNFFVTEEGIWKTYPGRRDYQAQSRPHISWDEGGLFQFSTDGFNIDIVSGENSFTIDDVNFRYDDSNTIVYNKFFGVLPELPEENWNVLLSYTAPRWIPNESIQVSLQEVDEFPTALDDKQMLLTSSQPRPEWLTDGVYTLNAEYRALDSPILGMIGGGGIMVNDGQLVTYSITEREGILPSFIDTLHPRSAVGLIEDENILVFVSVDGRQSDISRGVSLTELGEMMIEMGCDFAMNLDGGGSTSLVVAGEVVNFPSDASGPRSITNALVVSRTAPVGEASSAKIFPPSSVVPSESQLQLAPALYADGGEQLESVASNFVYTATGATVRETGMLTFTEPGTVTVEATYGENDSIAATATYTVVMPDRLELEPQTLLLSKDGMGALQFRAYFQGQLLDGASVVPLQIETPDFLTWDSVKQIVTAIGSGAGTINVTMNGLTASCNVAIDQFDESVVYTFDGLSEKKKSGWMTLLRADEEGCALALNEDLDYVQEGSGSWRWDYAMASGGTTKIALPMDVAIPGAPEAIALWVYGDGNGQWMRGTLSDSLGSRYYLPFTDAEDGISWKDEWKQVQVRLTNLDPARTPNGPLTPPFKLDEIYLVQPNDSKKSSGRIYLDGLSTLTVPEAAK